MENNYNVSLDAGENIKELLQQLANQIGVTVDKIFPWYVKQEVIEGYTSLFLLTFFSIIGIILLIVSLIKADFDKGNGYIVSLIVSCIILFSCCLAGSTELSDMIGKINNPEFFATKSLIYDISRLKP